MENPLIISHIYFKIIIICPKINLVDFSAMASNRDGASKSINATRARKRIEAKTTSLKRAKDGSAYTKCEQCQKDVAVALISMHDCDFEARVKMNLETQVVDGVKEVKRRTREKDPSIAEVKSAKKVKKERDPNKPKKPKTAFFLFMEEFRKTYKEENPNVKKASMVAKEAGEKWKFMTDEEKKPYTDRAAELKEEQQKVLEPCNDGEIGLVDAEGEANDEDSSEKGEKVVVVSDYE